MRSHVPHVCARRAGEGASATASAIRVSFFKKGSIHYFWALGQQGTFLTVQTPQPLPWTEQVASRSLQSSFDRHGSPSFLPEHLCRADGSSQDCPPGQTLCGNSLLLLQSSCVQAEALGLAHQPHDESVHCPPSLHVTLSLHTEPSVESVIYPRP